MNINFHKCRESSSPAVCVPCWLIFRGDKKRITTVQTVSQTWHYTRLAMTQTGRATEQSVCTHTHTCARTQLNVGTVIRLSDIKQNGMRWRAGLRLLLHCAAESWEGTQSGSSSGSPRASSQSNGRTGQLLHSWHCPASQCGITHIVIHPVFCHSKFTVLQKHGEELLKAPLSVSG